MRMAKNCSYSGLIGRCFWIWTPASSPLALPWTASLFGMARQLVPGTSTSRVGLSCRNSTASGAMISAFHIKRWLHLNLQATRH